MQLFSAELGKGVEKYLKTCKEEGACQYKHVQGVTLCKMLL